MFRKLRKQNKKITGPLLLILTAAAVLFLSAVVLAAIWPEKSGKKLLTGGKLSVDAGNSADGYVLITAKKSKKRYKLRVFYGKEYLTYDLNGDNEWEVFPLQSGSGKYEAVLYEQVSGKKYSQAGKVSFKAALEDEEAAYLCPNQYVNYTEESPAYQLSFQVCEGLEKEKDKYEAICNYMKKNLLYDHIKAITVTAGTLPDMDGCLEKGMGICQDLSAVMVCMLRAQGIHARLVIGYADNLYHAWVTANVDGEEQFFDPTLAVKAIKKVKAYTAERQY